MNKKITNLLEWVELIRFSKGKGIQRNDYAIKETIVKDISVTPDWIGK